MARTLSSSCYIYKSVAGTLFSSCYHLLCKFLCDNVPIMILIPMDEMRWCVCVRVRLCLYSYDSNKERHGHTSSKRGHLPWQWLSSPASTVFYPLPHLFGYWPFALYIEMGFSTRRSRRWLLRAGRGGGHEAALHTQFRPAPANEMRVWSASGWIPVLPFTT